MFLKLSVVLMVAMSMFMLRLDAEQKKNVITKPVETRPYVARKIDPANEQAKWERYIQSRNSQEQKVTLNRQMAKSNEFAQVQAVDIDLVANTDYWQADYTGDLIWTGVCYNAGSTAAVYVRVDIDVYDASGILLGSDYTYVRGGNNVKMNTTGIFTNELGAGQWGFFKVWTYGISYSEAWEIRYTFTYGTCDRTQANAQLSFDGNVYYTDFYGSTQFYGNIQNSSTNYLTYFTQVYFAVFDTTDTYVLDVDYTYVDGKDYQYSTGNTTDTSIYPGGSEPYDVWFLYADYADTNGSYMSSFEWYEAPYSSPSETDPPFGQFATPVDGSTGVAGSIAVTGWALDDSGVSSVKVYRQSGGNLIPVGDAVFVEGARPDIASMYPGYPNNTQAGWGYMMLTNFLPNGGNGTFTFEAIATDVYGKSTSLGTKTITCDNTNAVKPFGAIETPTQGGSASGSAFVNWGWALTPQPDSIPTDGTTIDVVVDGVPIGHPDYNLYRKDIADLFPTYANSSGALGYFELDTTSYADGVHTIQWTATDTGNDRDGIGSRYFAINNGSRVQAVREDFADKVLSTARLAQADNTVDATEMEIVKIKLNNTGCKGYMLQEGKLYPLPTGSTLDSENGIFYWQPGYGYMGRFPLVFVKEGTDGKLVREDVTVNIKPKKFN